MACQLHNPTWSRARRCKHRPFPVHKHISSAVCYKDNPHSLTQPRSGRDPGRTWKKQSYSAAMTGLLLELQGTGPLPISGHPSPPGHAEFTTFTTNSTNLNLYTHYTVPSEKGRLEYHQYPVKSTNLIDSHQGFKDGRRVLRNEQDHAREQSYALRDQLMDHWQQHREPTRPIAEGAPLPVADDTFREANVDEAEYVVVKHPCQPTGGVKLCLVEVSPTCE
jgi:hypothetical protein